MPVAVRQTSLLTLLVKQGVLHADSVSEWQMRSNGSQRELQTLLLKDNLLSESALGALLAEQCGVPFRMLDEFRVDFEKFSSISVGAMRQFQFVPIDEEDGVLIIAVPDPHDLPLLDRIEAALDREYRIVVAPRQAILGTLKESERNVQMVARVRDEFRPLLVHENEEGEEILSTDKISKDQSPVVQLVDTIILNALEKRASDIHLEPADGVTEVKYRIDGVLYLAMEPLDLRFHNPLVSRIKVMSDLDIAERRVPQDGRFKLRLQRLTIDFRVSVVPSAFGESVVIRILAKEEFTAG